MKSTLHSALKTSNQVATVVFVDARVENYQQLVNGVISTAEVFVLDAAADGIKQISQVLQQRQDVSAVHIVSHGAPGQIFVGRSGIALDDLTQSDLGRWRQSLSGDAEILLYGCNVAAGVQGRQFVERLAQLTGAAVYASDAVVGSPKRGGSWKLASVAGAIDIEALRSAFSPNVLAGYQGAFNQIINPTGGTSPTSNLKIGIYNNGTFQIARNSTRQVYSFNPLNVDDLSLPVPGTTFGIALSVGGTIYVSNTNSGGTETSLNNNPPLGFISQSAVSGAGTGTNPYQVTTSLYADLDGNNTYNAATDIKLDWTASYITSKDYFSNTFNITAPVGNTSDIKLFQHFDSYLAGGDFGPAYGVTASGTALTGTTDNPSFIGVRKNAGTPSEIQMGFVETNGNAFSSWYSGSNANPDDQILTTGNLTNTYDTTPTTDNGLAVQYNLGTVAGTKTITNDVAFSDNAVRDALDLPPVTSPTATSQWDFVTRDYNGDGATDIVAIKKNGTGTGTTEVHIMDGANTYKSWDLQTGTALGVTDNTWDFVKGDYDRDGKTDIFGIQKIGTATGTTEVHILDAKTQYQSFVLHGDTALGMTGDNFDFQAADYNRDGITDIIAIQKSGTGSGRTEIHILDGATNYKSWLLHTATVLAPTDNTWKFQVGDYDGDGITDIVGLKQSDTGTRTTEVHVLKGSTNYQSFVMQTGTALAQTGNNWDFLMDDYNRSNPMGIIGLKESDTGTGTTEAHILNQSDLYQSWRLQTGSVLPPVASSEVLG